MDKCGGAHSTRRTAAMASLNVGSCLLYHAAAFGRSAVAVSRTRLSAHTVISENNPNRAGVVSVEQLAGLVGREHRGLAALHAVFRPADGGGRIERQDAARCEIVEQVADRRHIMRRVHARESGQGKNEGSPTLLPLLQHIALTNDYVWASAIPPAGFRPLHDVRQTFQARAT